MTVCQASRGPWLVNSPALLTQPGGLAPQVPTPRIQGLHFPQQCVTPLPQFLGCAGELVVSRAAVPREKKHPLAQQRRSLLQLSIERAPVELRHPQVTENHVIALPLERREGMPAIARRCHYVPVPRQ